MAEGDSDWERQRHADMGGIDARLVAAERGIDNLGQRFEAHATGVSQQFGVVNQSIRDVGRDLATQISAANMTFASSGRTPWNTIISAVGLACVIGGLALAPMSLRLGENTAHIERLEDTSFKRDDFWREQVKTDTWLTRLTDRVHADEEGSVKPEALAEMTKRLDQRDDRESHENEVKIAQIEQRIASLDAQLVKRPEIETKDMATSNRIDQLAHRADQDEADFRNLNPISRVFDEIFNQVREMRAMIAPYYHPDLPREQKSQP